MGFGVYFIGGLIAVFGGTAMARGKSYATAFSASVMACVPCFSPCIVLGIPFGIWAIIALRNPETKRFFEQKT